MYYDLNPTPKSIKVFERGIYVINFLTPRGVESHEAEMVGAYRTVVAYDDPAALGDMVHFALGDVRHEINQALRESCRVADATDYGLEITVRARAKTWPAIPGLTVPDENPMLMGAS